ncbi:autotransporter domain-containing protein [Bradyrhizobium sp.]|uniref:autotransporter domain-containing protein n=1 Tax=Bradyrhizobium sp. TaxID=376 RepID=UPI002DDD6F2E|nr:autotransporter domain-containing protein [Bradyrhizobium sp.]HEV2156298.1 autotransporter domain-containing protein [Bradyrhizobium sp.]
MTATCTGTTIDQGGLPPGTITGTAGYGAGTETGITVNVGSGASVTGTGIKFGIAIGTGTVTNSGSITGTGSYGVSAGTNATVINNVGASIKGGATGVWAAGTADVTNSGSIIGTGSYGVDADAGAKVTNNVGASITGASSGVVVDTGSANVTNSGSIVGTTVYGIRAGTNVTVTNNASASITGGLDGVAANAAADITNSGSIIGTTTFGIGAGTDAKVTNNAGASITGGSTGVFASTGSANVTNSGSITGTGTSGIYAATNATVVNNAGGSIAGGQYGIRTLATADITNSGSITSLAPSGVSAAISAEDGATVVNNAGGIIRGGKFGILANSGSVGLTNSGTISGSGFGISAQSVAVTNTIGASITGGDSGAYATTGSANVTNSGSITGAINYGIFANTDATVINNAGGSITGHLYGVLASTGAVNITNSGSITGTVINGVVAKTNLTVTNNAGASISSGGTGTWSINGSSTVTNSGSIIGTGLYGILASTYATVTNNAGGSISGGVNGIFATGGAGGSSVFNAGTISGGTNAIQFTGTGNTLTLAAGSVISGLVLGGGSDTFQLGGTGTASFDVSQLGAAAQYQGFGTFNKIDSSVWTLTGTSTYAGAVNVNGGTLAVNGDISAASLLTVNAGGTLGGNGIAGAVAINGGTLAPGNSIGTLTTSSLTMTAASTYLVQVSGATSDKTIVTGTASVNGKVVVDPLTRVSATTTYTILTAGTVNGTFSGADFLTANNFARNARLSYVGNEVLLTLDAGLLSPSLPGYATINQKNVAAGIDTALAGGGTMPAGFNALFALSGNPLLNALTQASGETATGAQQTTFDAMNLFLGVLTDPFVAGRGNAGASPGGATGYAADDSDALGYASGGRKRSGAEREAYAAIYRKAPLAQAYEPRWSVWASGFGGTQTTDGNGPLGSNTTTSRIAGAAVGADYWFSPYTVAGFALAGGGTNFSVANGGTGRSDLFQAGAFVRHNIGPAYITGALAYGWQDITTDRTVTIAGADHLQARFNANAYSGRLEGGYRFVAPWIGGVGITPYAAAQFTTFDLPAYTEQAITGNNTFALSYASKAVTDTRSELGLRTDKSFALNDAIVTLRGRAAWAHDFNADRNIAATFQALPGSSFVVNGAAQAHDAALTTASAEVKLASGLSLAATFEGQFSDVTRSYAGKGTARYAW